MTSVVVADTGPLIALARVGCLNLLRRLYREVTVPPAVEAELELTSERPGAAVLAAAFEDGWLRCTHIAPARDEVQELGRLLDAGEVEAIVLAKQRAAQFLLIDDARGRVVARRRGLRVVGVPGVLLVAKEVGELGAVAPVMTELARIGYRLSDALVAAVLERAGEGEGK